MTQQLHSWTFILEKMKTYIHTKIYAQIFMAALFITSKPETILMSLMSELLNKMWYIRTLNTTQQ